MTKLAKACRTFQTRETAVPNQASVVAVEKAPPVITTVEDYDGIMFLIGELARQIDRLRLQRDAEVADIDKNYADQRAPLVTQYNWLLDAAIAFASDPDNKGRMTTRKAPQTSDLTHSKTKWTEDHTGQLELADNIDEQTAIRALLRKKGGSRFVITKRSINWKAVRANPDFVSGMRHFVRKFKKTSVALYVKPAQTPKPDGMEAERRIERLS